MSRFLNCTNATKSRNAPDLVLDPLIEEDEPVVEEFEENEMEEDDITLEGGQLVNANVLNSTQSLTHLSPVSHFYTP